MIDRERIEEIRQHVLRYFAPGAACRDLVDALAEREQALAAAERENARLTRNLEREYDTSNALMGEIERLRIEEVRLREALCWSLARVAMPGCRCATGGDGPCTCDHESWPEYKRLRQAEALASAPEREATCGTCRGEGVVPVSGYSVNPGSGVLVPDPQLVSYVSCADCDGTGEAT